MRSGCSLFHRTKPRVFLKGDSNIFFGAISSPAAWDEVEPCFDISGIEESDIVRKAHMTIVKLVAETRTPFR